MKKYAILSTDYSTLADEVLTYLKSKYDIDDDAHFNSTFHQFDPAELSGTSINTTFPGLTARAVCHASINTDAMYNHCCDQSLMCIPLSNCETTVLKVFDIVPGALPQRTSVGYYLDQDVILENTIPLTQPIILRPYTPFKMVSSNPNKLSHVLSMWFNEDSSPYLM